MHVACGRGSFLLWQIFGFVDDVMFSWLAKSLLDQIIGSPCERRRVAIDWVTGRSGCDGIYRTWLDVESGLRKHWWQQCERSSLWSSGLKIEAREAGRR